MKRIGFIVLMIAVTSTGLLFARGTTETEPATIYSQWGITEDTDTTQVTGTLTVENRIFPELKSGGNTWKLIYPRPFNFELDVTDGQRITVEGYETEDPHPKMVTGNENDVFLLVTKAVIDGEEYSLDDFDAPRSAMLGRTGRGGSFKGRNPGRGNQKFQRNR